MAFKRRREEKRKKTGGKGRRGYPWKVHRFSVPIPK